MSVIITSKIAKNKEKKWYYFEWGKAAGQRIASGIFTYTKPKDQIQKNHNKEALAILETKRSEMILDHQAGSSGYIPKHRIKNNFLDYYEEFVKLNGRTRNRHLQCSLAAFKKFAQTDYVSPNEITEIRCEQFRKYLLDNFNGETPAGYFMRFKKVLHAAKKDGYFKVSPAEDLAAKSNPNKKIKEILSEQEYAQLMKTPCLNYEVKKAFIFSLYTGLRWADVKPLTWKNISNGYIMILQKKTNVMLELPLHEMARRIIAQQKKGLLFNLPTLDGANKILKQWCNDADLKKHITWHCARHSFSVLLQRKGTDLATVAGMLGHTTIRYVHQTYKRYIREAAVEAIGKLPLAEF